MDIHVGDQKTVENEVTGEVVEMIVTSVTVNDGGGVSVVWEVVRDGA